MNEIPFRQILGFTQEMYAGYLAVSKGLVSLYEIGKRNLSHQASKRHSALLARWNQFEKTWIPPAEQPLQQQQLNEAREFLKSKIHRLIHERDKEKIRRENSTQPEMDYPKVNAFLQQEAERAESKGEQLFLNAVLAVNKGKQMNGSNPLLIKMKKSLEDRFLDFQIAEYQKELDQLGNP